MVAVGILRRFICVALLALLFAGSGVVAVRAGAAEALVKRDILAVYDGHEEKSPDQTRIHKFLEMPLNHLGYRVTYWDLKKGRPPPELTLRHVAVVTWFGGKVANADAYFDWATWAARMKLRFVLLGALGLEGTNDDQPKINRFFNLLGLEFVSHYVSATEASRIVAKDPAVTEYERKLPSPLPGYLAVRPKDGLIQAILSVQDPALKRFGPEAALLVATSPAGGYAAANYAVEYDQKRGRLSWFIDPIAFLTRALAGPREPIADTTTRAGRRMYLSHIDGDGWNNTAASAVAVNGVIPIAAETVHADLILPFPDLPVTIGLISCDVEPGLGSIARSAEIARKLYALPQVEVASHTHTHPFDWMFYEKYSRSRELERIHPPAPRPARVAQADKGYGGLFDIFGAAPTPPTRALTPPATATPGPAPALPRYKYDKPFDLASEVSGSLRTAAALAPEGKRAKLYLWSGDTRPFEAAVRATRQARVRNMNGGDTRYDSEFSSLAYVRPLSRLSGRERQIFSPNANEMIYTHDWKGPYNGFSKLRETFDRTEKPRRLKPANLYYHMFSADQPAGLAAVRSHLAWARSAPVHPVAASQYAAIADDFFEAEFERAGTLAWRVLKRGELQTIRFDDAASLMPDYQASAGVLGHTRHNGSLYVALDPAAGEVMVALQADGTPSRAHLIESRWDIRELRTADCAIGFKASGFGRGDMRWAGLKPGTWEIKVIRDGQAVVTTDATVNETGGLHTSIDADARAGGMVEMRCAS